MSTGRVQRMAQSVRNSVCNLRQVEFFKLSLSNGCFYLQVLAFYTTPQNSVHSTLWKIFKNSKGIDNVSQKAFWNSVCSRFSDMSEDSTMSEVQGSEQAQVQAQPNQSQNGNYSSCTFLFSDCTLKQKRHRVPNKVRTRREKPLPNKRKLMKVIPTCYKAHLQRNEPQQSARA